MQHHRWVEKEAAGVVAAIVAYNYPTQLALGQITPFMPRFLAFVASVRISDCGASRDCTLSG